MSKSDVRWTRAQHEAYKALTSGAPMSDETKTALAKTRAKPVQRERAEQVRLTILAQRVWWRPGYRHHMQERASQREAWRGKREGVRPGWPDVTLHIPLVDGQFAPVLAALELKVGTTQPTKAQLDCLALLEACGYQTKVAWGADEAFEWLDKVAGPRPDVLPEGWR